MLNYKPIKALVLIVCTALILGGCKKDGASVSPATYAVKPHVAGQPYQIGFYTVESNGVKELRVAVSEVGEQQVSLNMTFDTGSGGLVVDAQGILPASMISSTGFSFPGDSTTVNGVTITNRSTFITYGANQNTLTKVYGNLAYADVAIGDNNGSVTIKRLPFFLYYKAVDASGKAYPAHEFDVMGVSSEYDVTFGNGAHITSPLAYFDPGPGLTRGFKIAALDANNFTKQGTYVPAVTLGLTSDDLTSAGFNIVPLLQVEGQGYAPVVRGTIAYNGKSYSANLIFDSGTSPYFYLEDPNWNKAQALLNSNTSVQVSVGDKFNYNYTANAATHPTLVENPFTAKGSVSVISLNFFVNNQYLLDFDHHQLGLKNN